ncbi:glycoside hydrolase domain-containing protein [Kribbella sp. NPDC058245]|uniref:glycoside hydrolase domain-containing protein n=1 Tax=Kribbella sp. NPDC058245 TaxID=3346399 RepID=UPI0036EB9D15
MEDIVRWMRGVLAGGLIIGLGVAVVPPEASAATAPGSWVESAYTSVFKDSGPSAEATDELRLDTARNDYEAGQVVLRSPAAFTISRVDFTDLTGASDSIAAANLSYNFVGYQSFSSNSLFNGASGPQPVVQTIRNAPADFPDRLLNDTSLSVAANTTRAVWVRVYVPATAAGGAYRGQITVRTSAGDIVVPLLVKARAVTIPEGKDGGFTTAMWQSTLPAAQVAPGAKDMVEQLYGHKRYSAAWWQLVDNQAALTKRYRGNSVHVPVIALLTDAGSTFDPATGQYTFKWDRFDEWIAHFQANGSVRRLEGFNPIGGTPRFRVTPLPSTPGGQLTSYDWDSPTGANWINQYVVALRDHVRAKGWSQMWFQHISDEQQDVAEFTEVAKRYRELWPDISIGDAVVNAGAAGIAKVEDIVIPNTLTYTDDPETYDAERAKGKDLWLYQAVIPVGSHLNRFLDQAQWNQRMTMWLAYSRGANGYLHWAYNGWLAAIDGQSAKGDHWITQPDVARNTIEVTTRYESMRDGIEDWEVLNILGKTKPGLATELARSLVTASNRYTFDISYMQRIRAMALDAAAGLPLVPQDLAAAKPATASSQSADAAKAVDGDSTTTWSPATATSEQWLQVDLGRQARLNGISLTWSTAPASYKIQLSYNGSHWSEAHAVTSNDPTYFAGIDGKARFVRIVVPAGSAPVGLASVQVSGQLLQQNLAGGKTYDATKGTAVKHDDAGEEATDGVLSRNWGDQHGFGYAVPDDGRAYSYDVTVDLGVVQTVARAATHVYEDFPGYQPDAIKVSTSGDGVNFTQQAQTGAVNGMWKTWYQADFAPTRARYVRFTFVKTRSGDRSYVFFDDVEVYGVGSVQPNDEVPGSAAYRFGNDEVVFAPTANATLMRWNWSAAAGTKAADWAGGPIAGRPSGYVWNDQQHAVARSADGQLLHWWLVNGQSQPSFANWAGDAASDPVAAVWGGQQHIFARAGDGALSHWWWDPADQKLRLDKWAGAPGPIVGRPAVYAWRDQLHVVARGADNHLYHWRWAADEPEPHFADWGGEAYSDPTAFSWQGQQHVFAQAADGQLQHWWWDTVGGLQKDKWTGAPGKFVGAPAGYAFGDEQQVVARGPNNTLYKWFWKQSTNKLTFDDRGGQAYSDPIAFQINGQQQIFARSATNTLYHWWWTPTEGWQQNDWGGSVSYQP